VPPQKHRKPTQAPSHGGTEALRRGLHPSAAGRAFVLDLRDGRTLDMVAETETQAAEYVEGLKLLLAESRTRLRD